MRIIRRLLPTTDGEKGAALGLVLIIGFALTIVVATATTFAVSNLVKSGGDADWNAAMAAAYAGVEDYQSRLSNDNTYVQYGNPAAAFTIETGSQSKVALPITANPAFGVGVAGTWATVAGSGGVAGYRYEVDNSKYSDSGILRLRSTGRVRDEIRSVVVNLKQQGFIDFLYFTDYEIQDPDQSGVSESTCVKYAYNGRPSSGCSEIAFGSNDAINGPAHSNDIMRVCDATFNGVVTTAYNPGAGLLRYTKKNSNGSSCGGQNFTIAGSPAYSPIIGMPPTNSEMRKEVRYDLAERPGCLYTGPTSFVFNSDGTMTVRSPLTKVTQINGATPPVGINVTQCGTPGTGSNKLGSSSGQTIPVLAKNLIFVQNVPAATNDPNYTSTSTVKTDCKTSGKVTNGLGYPISDEDVSGGNVPTKDIKAVYGCRVGDVFVKGNLHGTMTIAAENYVYVTGDIKYVDAQADMLGLVGNNAVWVWNPIEDDGDSLLSNNNRRIDAAILSVAHTFQVQNYVEGGNRGTLTVNGAIAQKFRGIVRSGSNGYAKNYVYDVRYRYMAPPKFLSPVSTSYGVSELVEVADGYKPDGATP